jgi:N-acetylglucosamine-6-phosphate deacetylase
MKQTEIELILRAEKTIDELKQVKAAIENTIVESEKLRETNEKGFKGLKGTLKNAQTGIKNLAKGFSGASLAAKGFVLGIGCKDI